MNSEINTDIIKADLHLHSVYSDGKLRADELIQLLISKSISLFSITDHDTAESIEELKKMEIPAGMKYIPGIEFSTEYDGREIHILSYNFDYENKTFKDYINFFRKKRAERIIKIIERLNYLGLKFQAEDFFNYFKETKSIGRPHIAEYIFEKGYVKTYKQAFDKYIGDLRVAYFKKENTNTLEILSLIREINGISVLAHPGKGYLWKYTDILLKGGLMGIEIYHPAHTMDMANNFEKFANENNLVVTGGSDFHGQNKDDYKSIGRIYIDTEKLKFL